MSNCKRIVAIVTSVDNFDQTQEALDYLVSNSNDTITEIILLDNGSYTPVPRYNAHRLIRFEKHQGANCIFHKILPYIENDFEIAAFFHCDFMVREKGWDHRVLKAFDDDLQLGLIGFVGSNQMDYLGNRGLGTYLNFKGETYLSGVASSAEIHGIKSSGNIPGAVIDHCSMILPISLLREFASQEDHSPGHYYDRTLSCEMLYNDYHILLMGVACDHFSGGIGGTPDGLKNRTEASTRWCEENGIPYDINNVDVAIFKEGERRFLKKWRDTLKFIPLTVDRNYIVKSQHPESDDRWR